MLLLAVLAGALPAGAQWPPPDQVLSEPRPALLKMGPLDVHGRAVTSFVYDDNISLHERPKQDGIQTQEEVAPLGADFVYTFTPGITFMKAATLDDSHSSFRLDYSPSFVFFVRNSDQNSIDQSALLNAGYAWTKLTLGLGANFSDTSGAVVDVGDRVNQRNFSTALTARYELSEKTFLLADGSFNVTDYEDLNDSTEWKTTMTANYQISPKVTLGLGATYGQLDVFEEVLKAGSTNQTTREKSLQRYVGPTVRASYRTTEKTDIALSVGGEWRVYADGDTRFAPVFALSGTYRPWEGTTFTVEGHQREQNSAVIAGANYTTTGASLSVRQRLRERLFGTASFTYDFSDYEPVEEGTEVDRQDDYFLLRCGLEVILGQSWSVGVFYQYRQDVSTDESYSFQNNQVGIQAAWGY